MYHVGNEPPVIVKNNMWFDYNSYKEYIAMKNKKKDKFLYAVCINNNQKTGKYELLFGGFEREEDAIATLIRESRYAPKEKELIICKYSRQNDKNAA